MSEDIRQYEIEGRSIDLFGRVLCSARNHHFIVDGPMQNGCPGEAITPVEVFLSGVAACGVELVQVLARQEQIPLQSVYVKIAASIDRSKQVRPDVTLFQKVELDFELSGVSEEQGSRLIELFKVR